MSQNSSGTQYPSRRKRRRKKLVVAVAVIVVLLLVISYGTKRVIQTRSWQIAGELVSRVETDEKVVALTFDDGPTDADADAVLDVLEDRDVPATFYVNGKDVEGNPTTMQRIIDDGHEIGNHTWSHRSMAFVSPETVAEEIEPTDEAIRATGYDGPLTFRPPHGKKLLTLPLYLAEHGRLTVTWDVAYEDWSGDPQSTGDLVSATVENTRPGSIILLHPWFGRTATQEAIGPVIDQLKEQGYRFVTVSELIG
ncbi:polysaccharide deacetylase family protein [Neomicrococcus lactis]|uniref:Peptidoglycan/xylan/chitin deacetylase (PgdA/CDA1 family) n=1 Tax=Neomicrococcus lactis TaxID=732241 RepID=A0A7W8YCQ0_9MICC|nr:polysaccharide deacetylase family protein [Neomicrococcus lactis]MBB5599087.1 peptidoglycan/xylan/chitin deacetylase (PgdA/CDA1 family) [Neomicrococcus lactis]